VFHQLRNIPIISRYKILSEKDKKRSEKELKLLQNSISNIVSKEEKKVEILSI